MNVLILSCNTGEGHNAAGRALEEYLKCSGEKVEMLDFMKLASERTSRIVGGTYVSIAKITPHFFGFIYQLGMKVSNKRYKSPVYYANALMAKYLSEYLKKHTMDILVIPHLYPAETITYMKKRGLLRCKTLAIATDYTCIPFWEQHQYLHMLIHYSIREREERQLLFHLKHLHAFHGEELELF